MRRKAQAGPGTSLAKAFADASALQQIRFGHQAGNGKAAPSGRPFSLKATACLFGLPLSIRGGGVWQSAANAKPGGVAGRRIELIGGAPPPPICASAQICLPQKRGRQEDHCYSTNSGSDGATPAPGAVLDFGGAGGSGMKSKASFSPEGSSITFTTPPLESLPNRISSASGFLICS